MDRSQRHTTPHNDAPMSGTKARVGSDRERRETNSRFYDALWTDARLIEPERFNTWPLVGSLVAQHPRRLEVAPGLRPRLPIEGTHFVDQSAPAVASASCTSEETSVSVPKLNSARFSPGC